MKVTARYTFEAAHRLVDPTLSKAGNAALFGPCARVHGHTYRLEVTISGKPVHGMVMNFADLDALVGSHIIARVDHGVLDDVEGIAGRPSTAESLAEWVFRTLSPHFGADSSNASVALETVTVYEGDRFSATVERELHEG